MEKGFVKHFMIIGAGTIINMILGFFTTPIITRMVDPIDYGQFSIFTMYGSIAILVLCLGLDQALVRYYYERQDTDYKNKLLYQCLFLPTIISVAVSIVFIYLLIREYIQFEFNLTISLLLCIYVIISVIYRFSLLLVRLEHDSKMYSILNIIHKGAYILLAIPLVALFKSNHIVLLSVATVFSVIVCLIVSIYNQKKIWKLPGKEGIVPVLQMKELFLYSYPYIFSMGLTTVFQAADKLAINHYCTYVEVGVYASAMSLVHIFAIIQTTFNSLWTPMSVEHFSENPDDKEFYVKIFNIISLIMFVFGVTLILSKNFISCLLGEKYREAAYVLPFLIFNPIFLTIAETTSGGLVFMKKSKYQVLVSAVSCLVNLIGNNFLVPILGIKGAALSTGVSYIVYFFVKTALANRFYKIDFKLNRVLVVILLVSAYATYNMFYDFGLVNLICYLVINAVIMCCFKDGLKDIIDYLKQNISKIVNRYGV